MTRKQLTAEVFADPQPGNRLSEMLTFWVIVLDRCEDQVWWLEATSPCTLPQDGEAFFGTVEQFSRRFAYRTHPGWFVRAVSEPIDVEGWLAAVEPHDIALEFKDE